MVKKRTIITNNREIYEKFNMLHFSPEVLLKNVKIVQVTKIVKRINREKNLLAMERLKNYIIVKKTNKSNSLNFNIYLK